MRAISPALTVRPVRFDEVSELLRLIRRAIERGCRDDYDPAQRASIFTGYARTLFVEVLGPFDTLAAEQRGRLVGIAQLDATSDRLRALFVDGDLQGHGLGQALLRAVERRARQRGCARLHGAMALNAVSFYSRAGFRPVAGPENLGSAGIPVPVVRMVKDLR
jgi:GNAT superfamily N-acetyltransferase